VGDEGAGLFAGLLLALPGLNPVTGRSMADLLLKKGAEGTDALEAHLVTDLRDGKRIARKAFPGLLDPFSREVLMGGYSVDAGKEPVKMKTRQAGLPGKAIQIDGPGEIAVDIQFGRNNLFIYVWGYWHALNFNGTLFAVLADKFSKFAIPPSPKGPEAL
jgi:hypothetical protein